jgi:hypothetical protein
LGKARLDWQVSLSASLRLWLRDPPDVLTDGELILAWTNLGALIEGTLKLFLSVYYNDFRADVENLKAAGAFDHKAQASKSPDGLMLEPLRKYVAARDLIGASGDVTPEQYNQLAAHGMAELGFGAAVAAKQGIEQGDGG